MQRHEVARVLRQEREHDHVRGAEDCDDARAQVAARDRDQRDHDSDEQRRDRRLEVHVLPRERHVPEKRERSHDARAEGDRREVDAPQRVAHEREQRIACVRKDPERRRQRCGETPQRVLHAPSNDQRGGGEETAEVFDTAGAAEEEAGERVVLAVEAIEAGGDEKRECGIDVQHGAEVEDDRTAEEQRGRERASPFVHERGQNNELGERHEMRRDVAADEKRRHAQQLVQLRKDGEAVAGQKLQSSRLRGRADEGEVVERLVECERGMQREEEERDEERQERQIRSGAAPALGRRNISAAVGGRRSTDRDDVQRDDRRGAQPAEESENEQCVRENREAEGGAERERAARARDERARAGGGEQNCGKYYRAQQERHESGIIREFAVRMRILILTPRLPWPAVDGGRVAMSRLARSLADCGADVEVLSLNPRKHRASASGPVRVRAVDIHTSRVFMPALRALSGEVTYLVARFVSKKFCDALTETLRRFEPDVVQIESPFLLPYASCVREAGNARVVLRSLNVEFRIWESLGRTARTALRRLALRRVASGL